MHYDVPDKEFESLNRLTSEERYTHFIKRIAEHELVWTLGNDDGFVTFSDDDGIKHYAFWPHERYAQEFAVGEWGDCVANKIGVYDWLEKWLCGMSRDGFGCVIFPTLSDDGVSVESSDLHFVGDDLKKELENYS